MSDENLIHETPDSPAEPLNGAEWSMPAPIFRSTEGKTPGDPDRFLGDEHETEIADKPESDVDAFAETLRDVSTDAAETPTPAVSEPIKVSPLPPKQKAGCGSGFMMLAAIFAAAAAIAIGVVIYFLYYYRPAETTF